MAVASTSRRAACRHGRLLPRRLAHHESFCLRHAPFLVCLAFAMLNRAHARRRASLDIAPLHPLRSFRPSFAVSKDSAAMRRMTAYASGSVSSAGAFSSWRTAQGAARNAVGGTAEGIAGSAAFAARKVIPTWVRHSDPADGSVGERGVPDLAIREARSREDLWAAADMFSKDGKIEDDWSLADTVGNFGDLFVQQLTQQINPRAPITAIATLGDETVGMVEVTQDGYIRNLIVQKENRRQGIATKLIDWSKKLCRERGAQQLFLHVDRNNEDAIGFYKNLRFAFREYEGDLLEAYSPLRRPDKAPTAATPQAWNLAPFDTSKVNDDDDLAQ